MNLQPGKNKVTFKSFGVDLVGDLYLPEGFDENKTIQSNRWGQPISHW